MKNNIKKFLSKPSKVIPIFAIVVILITGLAFKYVGQAPSIPSSIENSDTNSKLPVGVNTSLSFPKTGRVERVLVKNGDVVKAGQVLAKLSAPDAEGAVNQARGALALAEAEYASLNSQYSTTKAQQDILVKNAYRTLLSSNLEGVPTEQDSNIPIISGTYTCDTEGNYIIAPYSSNDSDSGFSLKYSGIESGISAVKYDNSVPLGNCGLQIKFVHNHTFNPFIKWTISIPNTKSSSYVANKNAYDLAYSTREKVLVDLINTIGTNTDASVAKSKIQAAEGAYQAALGAYANNVITSPVNGIVTFVDPDLKIGQSVLANKSVISISQK